MIKKTNTYRYNFSGLVFIILVVFGFSYPHFASSQTDSLIYSEETQQDSIVQYLTPLEYAFMMHEETKWMVKVNLVIVNLYTPLNLNAFYERKISRAFTLSGGISFVGIFSNISVDSKFQLSTILEPRWYYNMAKRVKEGKGKFNMSGNYFALGTAYTFDFETLDDFESGEIIKTNTDFISLYAKWGMQRRFLKKAYIDFGVKASFNFYINENIPVSSIISTYINAGFVFAKDRQIPLDKDKLCSVLRCYASDRFLLKTNLNGLLIIGVNDNGNWFSFNPEFAAELKLGFSPFSLNAELSVKSIYQGATEELKSTSYFTLLTAIESRWYYNLKHRMLKGKTGNGLSANYFAFGISNLFYRERDEEDADYYPFNEISKYNELGIHLLTGIQRTYAKHVYIDVNFGFRVFQYLDESYFDPIFELTGLLAIGYRF